MDTITFCTAIEPHDKKVKSQTRYERDASTEFLENFLFPTIHYMREKTLKKKSSSIALQTSRLSSPELLLCSREAKAWLGIGAL